MFRAIQFVLVAVVLFGTCAVVQAESIPLLTNVTTGAAILQDGFESGTVGSPPGQYDPTVGEWVGYSSSGGHVWVTDEATSGIPAYEGSQFLEYYRQGNGVPSLRGAGTASGETDTVMFQAAFYSGVDGRNFGILEFEDATTLLTRIGIWPSGDCYVWKGGTFNNWFKLTQKWTTDQWNTLVVTHTNHTNDWTVSINGQTPETVDSFAAGATSVVTGINFSGGTTNNCGCHWDALPIPEPGTLALLATGLIGLLCYAWRRRK